MHSFCSKNTSQCTTRSRVKLATYLEHCQQQLLFLHELYDLTIDLMRQLIQDLGPGDKPRDAVGYSNATQSAQTVTAEHVMTLRWSCCRCFRF